MSLNGKMGEADSNIMWRSSKEISHLGFAKAVGAVKGAELFRTCMLNRPCYTVGPV